MRKIVVINSVVVILLALFFFIYPSVRAVMDIQDPALKGPGIPKAAWRISHRLTPRYASWAKERVMQGKAETLSVQNISGTEWPLFGSVFYLWAMENLQAAWEAGEHSGGAEPKAFAREAIIAASELVIDPKHAAWVQQHWGTNYLHRENVFYRMLVIAALTSRAKLLHDGNHMNMLRDQVETFANELSASPSGLLDDYPHECYPGDVMAAIYCIRRADAVLGTDHSKFVELAIRGFTGSKLTRHQLPPYSADAKTGRPLSESRGCGNSYFCLTAPELWPNQAKQWFEHYDTIFWQERISAVGYREYAPDVPNSEWTMDVDAGPVISGHGVSASAFGLGAARKNGRFDRAYPLATEVLATGWELPHGVLALPRLLSDLSDAPMLGEAAILWLLTIQPEKSFTVKVGGSVPTYVYIVVIGRLLCGALLVLVAFLRLRPILLGSTPVLYAPQIQPTVWGCAMLGAFGAFWAGVWWLGLLLVFIAILLPIERKVCPKVPSAENAQAAV